MFKTALVFLGISLFCIIFNYIYAKYSHGVHSSYMTFMFVYPLVGGTMVYLLLGALSKIWTPGRFALNLYNSGIAALTVGSMLQGIFNIAGTSSPYQPVFVIAGTLMMLIGAVYYVLAHIKKQ